MAADLVHGLCADEKVKNEVIVGRYSVPVAVRGIGLAGNIRVWNLCRLGITLTLGEPGIRPE